MLIFKNGVVSKLVIGVFISKIKKYDIHYHVICFNKLNVKNEISLSKKLYSFRFYYVRYLEV